MCAFVAKIFRVLLITVIAYALASAHAPGWLARKNSENILLASLSSPTLWLHLLQLLLT